MITEFLYAPMEGITLSRFRQIHHEMFPGVSEYYTPFIAPDSNGSFKSKFLRELTDDCGSLQVIPQLLVNNPDAFGLTADRLNDLGFPVINLNIGCPSGTVFSKHKGAGLLTDPDALDRLLGQIYERAEKTGYRVSVKTRMGVHSTDEFPAILEVYRRYPIEKLIVHARCRDDFYQGRADLAGFAEAAAQCRTPPVYNGDLASGEDLERLLAAAPETCSVMIGRAAVANPALFRVLQGGEPLQLGELKTFHDRLTEAWLEDGLSPVFTVERMKTLWSYLQALFPENRREVKAVLKARTMDSYRGAVSVLFGSGQFQPSGKPGASPF